MDTGPAFMPPYGKDDCFYVFNGCAHPQFCKDECAARKQHEAEQQTPVSAESEKQEGTEK